MRIIGGSARGRRLSAPGNRFGNKHLVRPTADRAREAIFNVIGATVQEARVLDLFAGSGALGLEALSRGAQSAVFVDGNQSVTSLIKKNIAICGFSDNSLVLKRDLAKGLFFIKRYAPPHGFTLVFLDPPYGRRLAHKVLRELANGHYLHAGTLVVAEAGADEALPEKVGKLWEFDRRRYGEAGFWLYRLME